MKTLKTYILENEYAGYHEIAGLDDKQIECFIFQQFHPHLNWIRN